MGKTEPMFTFQMDIPCLSPLRPHSHHFHRFLTTFQSPPLISLSFSGYDHVTPTTDPGRVFTVFFGLLGIPLMFITAADIGKFLSEIVIRLVTFL